MVHGERGKGSSMSALLSELRRKRLNHRALTPGEPTILVPPDAILITEGPPAKGGGLMFIRSLDLIKLVEDFLRTSK